MVSSKSLYKNVRRYRKPSTVRVDILANWKNASKFYKTVLSH